MPGKNTTASIALGRMRDFKVSIQGISADLPRKNWEPLRSHWTVQPWHEVHKRLEEFKAIQSLVR